MSTNLAWRKEAIGRQAWEANCAASSHVRAGDTLTFSEGRGTVTCWISGTSVFLGAYFPTGAERDGIVAGAGWCHT